MTALKEGIKSALFRGARTAFAKRQQWSRKGPKNHASDGVRMAGMMNKLAREARYFIDVLLRKKETIV